MSMSRRGLRSEAGDIAARKPGAGTPAVSVVLAAAAMLLVLGLGFAVRPISAVILTLGLGFAAAVIHRPMAGLVAFLLAQVISPLYLSASIAPGLPPFPVSLIVLAVTATIVFARTAASANALSHPVTIAYLAFGAALVLSILSSTAPGSSANALIRCYGIPLTAYLMAWRLVRSPREAILALDTLLLAAVIISLYGIVEFAIGWNPLIEKLAEPTGEDGDLLYWNQREFSGNVYRSFSVEMNPLFFGATVSMLVPYAIARLGVAATASGKFVYGTAVCLCLAGVTATFSRGPLVAIAVSSIGLAIVFPPVRRLVTVAIACGVLAGLAALPWLSAEIWERFSDPDNVSFRLKLWQLAWAMFLGDPVTGVGLNGFAHHQIDILRAHEIGPFPEHSAGELERLGTADGTFPQLAAETGALGVIAFLALFGVAAATVVRNLRHRLPTHRLIVASVGIAAGAYLLNGLTITVYTAYTPTIVLSVLLALAAALDDTDAGHPGPEAHRPENRMP